MAELERRAPVNGEPFGTISWAEHVEASAAYRDRFRNEQTAERIAERGGYGWQELQDFLGHKPKTWLPPVQPQP